MVLSFTDTEIGIIKIWADSTIHGGHWGDNDLIVPEEGVILEKLDKTRNGSLDLTKIEARIILSWSESSRGIHTLEEESAINKLQNMLKHKS
jgi:hypothetical protein